jgi:hypothetical protein
MGIICLAYILYLSEAAQSLSGAQDVEGLPHYAKESNRKARREAWRASLECELVLVEQYHLGILDSDSTLALNRLSLKVMTKGRHTFDMDT